MGDDDEDEEYEIERILADDVVEGNTFYLVKWKSYSDAECTWEPVEMFTSQDSIKEYYDQKAAGLNLPDDRVASLQKEMADFQASSAKTKQSSGEAEVGNLLEREADTEQSVAKQRKKQDVEALYAQKSSNLAAEIPRKGIANIMKAEKPFKPPVSTSLLLKPAVSSTLKQRRVKDTLDGRSNALAKKAGQRFNNLSHMNNYRKKLREEAPSNIPHAKLIPVSELDNARYPQIIEKAPDQNIEQRNDSPLFIPDPNPKNATTRVSPVLPDDDIFPPAKIDHRSEPAKTNAGVDNHVPRVVNAVATGTDTITTDSIPYRHKTYPSETCTKAVLPDPSLKLTAGNGRWWYKGDLLCHFTVGQQVIGDATIIHVPYRTYGIPLLKLKEYRTIALPLDFEKFSYNQREFEETFENYNFFTHVIGLICPFPDTEKNFNDFAEHLEHHDSAAVLHHPDPTFNVSLLMYSLNTTWRFIGRRPARVGEPRLHVAFLPKLIQRKRRDLASVQNPSFASLAIAPRRETANIAPQDKVPPSTEQHTHPVDHEHNNLPSNQQETSKLDNHPISYPNSPTSHSTPDTNGIGSPLSDWTNPIDSADAMTPTSPKQTEVGTRDPRRRKISFASHQHRGKERVNLAKPGVTLGRWHKLNYLHLVTVDQPANANSVKLKLDPKRARFFISFNKSYPDEAKHLRQWLEKHTAPSNIYYDTAQFDWVRFRDKADSEVSVLFFAHDKPNYQELPGLGEVIASGVPTCFSVWFQELQNVRTELVTLPIMARRIFASGTMYLITESMITDNLDETFRIAKYFDRNKRPGYKMMMRPKIERWLLDYAAQEKDEARCNKLIDLLVLIRNLHPEEGTSEDEGEHGTNYKWASAESTDQSYIVSPPRIPGYDDPTVIQQNRQDDIFRSYFFGYSAVHAHKFRRFICFNGKTEQLQYKARVKRKEEEGTLDCGHIWFLELEKFVASHCTQD